MSYVSTYLMFSGNCEEAFNFYKSIFGGEFSSISRFKEMPESAGFSVPESVGEKIMHMSYPIGEHTMLMGSDTDEAFGSLPVTGTNFSLYVNLDTAEETERVFQALSSGGQVTMPLNKTFWGSYFGSVVDPFGIRWMVSSDLQ